MIRVLLSEKSLAVLMEIDPNCVNRGCLKEASDFSQVKWNTDPINLKEEEEQSAGRSTED